MGSFTESGSSYRPSTPLEALGGQCRDLNKCPGIGQYLDVLWCSGTHTLVQTSSLVACALSEVLLAAVQLDQSKESFVCGPHPRTLHIINLAHAHSVCIIGSRMR